MPEPLPAIQRPDGRMYRPRKVIAKAVNDGDDLIGGVIVFGTHDIDRARALAVDCVAHWIDRGYVPAIPVPVWWRETYTSNGPTFAYDEKRGRAGIWFSEIHEAPPEVASSG